jgi:CRISPR/Cas system CSM-associated protein Csm3 (group 7 of RAMP superfamily)
MHLYNLEIKFTGNFAVGSGFGFARLVDRTSTRDEHGVAIIPGSTVKGRLRSICKRLAVALSNGSKINLDGTEVDIIPICQSRGEVDVVAALCKDPQHQCAICRLFGSPLFPSSYRFSNFTLMPAEAEIVRQRTAFRLMQNPADAEWVTRVHKNRYTGAAVTQALYCLEQVPAQEFVYHGQMTGPELIGIEKQLIVEGLKCLTHLGGNRSRGLGRMRISCPQLGVQ